MTTSENIITSTPIPCEGILNIRDLGGIPVAASRHLRPNRLLRSGKLQHATIRDCISLRSAHKLHAVIDLRTPSEMRRSPDNVALFPGISFINAPLLPDDSFGVVRDVGPTAIVKSGVSLVGDPIGAMETIYRAMVSSELGKENMRRVFRILLELPDGACALWHCSAGKDRVGVTTALVLLLLGADYDTVMADYLETNVYLASRNMDILDKARWIPSKTVRDAIAAVRPADGRFLDAALSELVDLYGDIDAYAREVLAMSDSDIAEFRAKFTEPD